MEDIYDIKGVEYLVGGDFIFYPILIVLFFVIFFIILNSYFSRNNYKKKKVIKKEKIVEEVKYEYIILDKLVKLEDKYEKMDKKIYYFEINTLFRNYLGFLYQKNFYKSTFEEIKLESLLIKKDNKKLIALFEKSYEIEFLELEDTLKKRKKILTSFENILKNT